MSFWKTIWTLAVGVKDLLVLLFLLLLFGAIWAGFNMGSGLTKVPDESALVLTLDGVLVDEPAEPAPLDFLTGGNAVPEIDAFLLVRAIDRAAKDDRIRMIVLDMNGFAGGGLANLEAVGDALLRFRKSGKRVESWATAYADDGYFLAAHADHIVMSPLGAVLIAGPGGNGLYFKDALDRLKVTVEVFRVGTYKSFIEPFTRNESSPEARAADQALADELWLSWREGVEKQRPALNVRALAESWPARVAGANRTQAELALDAGLVDTLSGGADFRAALVARVGAGENEDLPGDFNGIHWRDYLAAKGPDLHSGPAVGIVHVAGNIVDGEAPAGLAAGGTSVAMLIEEAIADSDVQAIVLRVDSGGGSVTASEVIREALLEAKKRRIPVVASLGPVAASGGYWVATGADVIFAQPSTITGSIGVFGIIPTFERTLESVGVHADGVATTALSGQPDIVSGLNAPARALLQGSVQDIYTRFLSLVADARNMPVAEVAPIAEGRVWSGRQALKLKLIDQHGDLHAAIAEAARRAGIKGEPRVVTVRAGLPLLARLMRDLEGQVRASAGSPDALGRQMLASRARAVAQVQAAVALADGPAVQVRCLICAAHAPVRQQAGVQELGAMLATLAR